MRAAVHLFFLVFVASGLFAAAPKIDKLEPRGGQGGTAVKLTLVGEGFDDQTRVISEIPGALTPLAPPKEPGRAGNELPYLLEIPADAAVGVYPVRVRSPNGLSNVLLFSIGAFPETADEEIEAAKNMVDEPLNDSLETAQEISVPATINGTLPAADRDLYRFSAKAGENLVLEAESRRIGSAIDPALEIFDAEGRRLAWNQDAAGIGVDSRIDFTFPEDGRYYVAIHDAKFSEQNEDFYRLKIGRFTYADGVFPLGWKRGESVEVEFFGGNLAQPVKMRADLSTEDPAAEFAYVSFPGEPGALPMRLALSSAPEALEPRGGEIKPLQPETVINGRIAKPGEIDRYRFPVRPGEMWHVKLQAATLGTSQLFGVLSLYDGTGEKLGTTREIGVRHKLSNLDVAEDPSADQHMSFEVPQGVREIRIEVEDLLGRGGRGFGYRLAAHRQPADFTLTIENPQVNIPLRGSALVTVTADRQGYDGPIKLSIPNLPRDLIMNGGHIPLYEQQGASRAQSVGYFTLTPKPGAKVQTADLEIWGEAEVEGKLIRRRARGPGLRSSVKYRIGERVVTDNVAPWLGADLSAMIVKEQPAVVELLAPHYIKLIQGTKTELPWEFTTRVEGVRRVDSRRRTRLLVTPNVRVRVTRQGEPDSGNPNKGVFLLSGQVGWGPGKFDVLLPVKIRADGREETLYSQAITIDVVRAYEVEPAGGITTLIPGEEAELLAQLKREEGFDREVEVKVENLPLGVSCETIKVPGQADEFRVPCSVEPNAEAGEFEIDLATSSTVIGGADKVIPFSLPPFKTKVRVAVKNLQASR